MRIVLNLGLAGLLGLGAAAVRAQSPPSSGSPASETILGQLLDIREDRPIAGAVVTVSLISDGALMPVRATPGGATGKSAGPRRALSNGDGRFVFRDLPPGRYAVSATAFGYLPNTSPPHWIDLPGNSGTTQTTLRLWKAASISGMVTDDRGDPVVGVPVTALRRRIAGGVALERSLDAMTDDRGQFRLAPLSPGTYVVAALSSSSSLPAGLASAWDASAGDRTAAFQLRSQLLRGGLLLADVHGVELDGLILQQAGPAPVLSPEGYVLSYPSTFYPDTLRAANASEVTVGSGEPRIGIDLSVRYSPTTRVSGRLIGPADILSHVALRLVPFGIEASNDADPPGSYVALTDPDGVFTFIAVPAGEYELTASVAVGSEVDGTLYWVSQPVTVDERGAMGLEALLKPGVIVTGRVEFRGEASTARPERLAVGLRPAAATEWRSMVQGTVRPDGTFTAVAGRLGPHEVYVAIGPSAWTWVSTSLGGRPLADGFATVTDAGVRDLVLTMSDAPPTLMGTVVNDRGIADSSADVIVFPADTALWRQGFLRSPRVRLRHVSSTGAFEIAGLPIGEYHVAAVPPLSPGGWMTTDFLDQLTMSATTVTMRVGEITDVRLTTVRLRER
jgi:hypothetical protein